MKILIIGSGGREHALAWKISQSSLCTKIFVAPGNAGTAEIAENVAMAVDDSDAIIGFCLSQEIDLAVIGPELPLTLGIVDDLQNAGIKVFGPSKAAAIIEGSKVFAKDFCRKYNIPTAAYGAFDNADDAKAFAGSMQTPIVIKADGLAAGKGVIIAQDHDEACQAIDKILLGQFGDAGKTIVVEEFLQGRELSFFVISDGNKPYFIGAAQDHKRAFDGGQGPNTGGMGAYSPSPILNQQLHEHIMQDIAIPSIAGMKSEGRKFKGVLFIGLMVDDAGIAKTLEYNIRFGDPEAQVILPLLKSDLIDIMMKSINGNLGDGDIVIDDSKATTCVVMAAKGYPGSYKEGTLIEGLNGDGGDGDNTDSFIFHAGTKEEDGAIKAIGGRVLGVTGIAENIQNARSIAYKRTQTINWPEGFYRSDIGEDVG